MNDGLPLESVDVVKTTQTRVGSLKGYSEIKKGLTILIVYSLDYETETQPMVFSPVITIGEALRKASVQLGSEYRI